MDLTANTRPVDAGRRRGLLMAAVVVALALLLGVALAQAGKGVLTSFGSSGSAEGQLSSPRGVAVNEGTGEVYVVDSANERVERFDSSGGFVSVWGWGVTDGSSEFQVCSGGPCQAGQAGGGAGQFSGAQGIAVDQSTGAVYVLDRDNLRVQQFDADGTFVRAWGWGVEDGSEAFQVCAAPGPCQAGTAGAGDGQLAPSGASGRLAVDPSSGHVYVADPGNGRVQEFGPAGAFVAAFGASGAGDGEFGADSPTGVAVDSTGDVYAVDPGNARVQRFDSAGAFEAVFAAGELSGEPVVTELAVNPADDHVLATRPCDPALCPDGPEVSDERRVRELSPAGTLVDAHMSNAGINDTGGVALDAASGRIYVSSTTGGDQVYVLDDIVAPTVDDVTVSSPSTTTAWFASSVNPQGSPTSYRFEYSDNGGADWTAVGDDVDAGADTSSSQKTQFVTGLKADTDYLARIVATKPFGTHSVTSTPVAFTTEASAPGVEPGPTTVSSDQGGLRKATLRARINPQGSTTGYRFEYGPTDSYGTDVPVADADIGASGDWVAVQQTIMGLAPHSTYHYRVVAENETSQTTSDDRVLVTGPGLPDGRRYEQVSPPDKNSSDILADSARVRAAVDGDRVQYASLGSFGDVLGTGVASEYIARRADDGWRTHSITPLQDVQSLFEFLVSGIDARYMGELSPDLSTGLFFSKTAHSGALNVSPAKHLFLRRDLMTPGTGTYDIVSDALAPLGSPPPASAQPWLAGTSADFTHVLFASTLNLTGETTGNSPKLYEWIEGTGTRLAGVLPASEGGGPAVRSIAGAGVGVAFFTPHTISQDGSRIFFTVGAFDFASEGDLYVRIDGTTTVKLNASERTDCAGDPTCGGDDIPQPMPDTPQPATYWDASVDGTKVFFTSDEQLTDTDGSGLYRYDSNAAIGARLTLLSLDHEPHGQVGVIDSVLGTSADGAYVYFAGFNQLIAGNAAPTGNDQVLYVWHDGTLRQVGTLTLNDRSENEGRGGWGLGRKSSRVLPSGPLVFTSRAHQGLTGYDSGACSDDGCIEVYVYSPEANEGAGALTCSSCRPDGAPATADANIATRVSTGGSSSTSYLSRPLSVDGRRVFFHTGEALVPEDRNGSRLDVYMYDIRNGQLHLISAGTGDSNAYLMDVSRGGDDVFFLTRERLVGWDVDDSVDLYDARVGGGFPEPVSPPEGCVGVGCRESSGSSPDLASAGSSLLAGPGDLIAGFEGDAYSLARISASARRKLARTGRVTLSVRVRRAGTVRATAVARLGDGMTVVAGARRRAGGASTVRLRLRLSGAAQRRLRQAGALRVRFRVRFSGVGGSSTALVLLRAPGSKGR